MQRYTVTVVDRGASGSRPTLAVPFEPSALVSAFIDELFRRIAKQGLKLSPNTHIATLHLDSETGKLCGFRVARTGASITRVSWIS